MGKSNFDKLIERYLSGDISEPEKAKLEAWLNMSKSAGSKNLELSKDDEDKLFERITSKTTSVKDVVTLRPGKVKNIFSNPWTLRIAASILLVIAVTYVAWDVAGRKDNKLQTVSRNGVEKIILNDGSIVWLQEGSNLVYYEDQRNGTRYSELKGEALFEVAKDAAHPFIVRCGDVNIKVVGTSFGIKQTVDQLDVKVLTGKVHLSSNSNSEGVYLVPNEHAVYKNGTILKFVLEQNDISAMTAHTEYNMKFTNAAISEVLEKLEQKFNVSVQLDNADIGDCRITADFTDQSLDSTLQMIAEVLDVKYTQDEAEISITGSGCSSLK